MSGGIAVDDKIPHRVVIVGGHSGGNGFMSQARRYTDDTEIILLEKGPYVGTVKCGLTHHLAGTVPDRATLLSTDATSLAKRFRTDIRLRHKVTSINRISKTLNVHDLKSDMRYELGYDKLLLATGATPAIPTALAGINLAGVHCLRTIADMDGIIEQLRTKPATHATVVGAGTIGLQAAEALRKRGLAVTLLDRANQVMRHVDQDMATLLHQAIQADGVQLLLNTAPLGFFGDRERIRVRLNNGREFATDLVILATGIRPNSNLAQAAELVTGASGAVSVDEYMRTSDPDIYAVGDLIETPSIITGKPTAVQISVPIGRQTRVAAAHMFGSPIPYRGALASFAWHVFGQSVASTGASERLLKEAQRPYSRVFIPTTNHVGFFPGVAPLYLKLLFCPKAGKILGAQAIGDGADKRIDVLATAITGGLSVQDLEYIELCYSPHFGSPKDAINQAGGMASGIMRGTKQVIQPEMVIGNIDQLVLDVRSQDEFAAANIPGSLNIPVEQLRTRLNELPKDKCIVVCCQIGSKAHTVQRTLMLHGYDAVTLMGGFTGWRLWHEADTAGTAKTSPQPLHSSVFFEERRRGNRIRTHQERRTQQAQFPATGHERRAAPQRSGTDRRMVWQQPSLDTRGMTCPGPILTLRKKIAELAPGQTICIKASDPAFPRDLEAWCNKTGVVLERVYLSSTSSEAYCSKKADDITTT